MRLPAGRNGKVPCLCRESAFFLFRTALNIWQNINRAKALPVDAVLSAVFSFAQEALHISILKLFEKVRGLSAHRLSLQLACAQHQLGGAGNDDLVSLQKLLHGEWSLVHRNAQAPALLNQMHSGNAGKDVVVGRMGDENAVL